MFRVGPGVPDFPLPRKAMEILLQDLEEGFAKLEEDLVNFTGSDAWVSITPACLPAFFFHVFLVQGKEQKSKQEQA